MQCTCYCYRTAPAFYRQPWSESLDQRRAAAPHGGLDDVTLQQALEDVALCPEFVAATESLATALNLLLKVVAVPSFVLVDATRGEDAGSTAPSLLSHGDFSLARHAASCLVLGPPNSAACTADDAYIRFLPFDTPPAEVLWYLPMPMF